MGKTRFVMVVNPGAGRRQGEKLLEAVRPVFAAADADLDVHVTTHAGHAQDMARTMDLARYSGFCVVGGDGTIHEAVGGLMQRRDPAATPLGIIPGGTGNTVLEHLQCSTSHDAARRIVAGKVLPLDVARVTMGSTITHCANILGWGAVVDINRTAEQLRALGPTRYAVAAISHILRAKRRPAKLILDGQSVEDDFLLIMACNTCFTGKGMKMAPKAHMGDGKIDVVVVRQASRWQMFKLFQCVFDGSHLDLPWVEYHQVRSFRIETDKVDPLNLDGELKGSTPVLAEIIPGALKVFA